MPHGSHLQRMINKCAETLLQSLVLHISLVECNSGRVQYDYLPFSTEFRPNLPFTHLYNRVDFNDSHGVVGGERCRDRQPSTSPFILVGNFA